MKVKDICDLQNGRAFKPSDWGTEGLPIVRIQNLNDESAPFNYYSGEYSKVHEIDDGDLLFSWSGTPGTSFGAFRWFRGKGVLNQHIFKVLPKIEIDLDYLQYALNGNLNSIIEKAHGGVGLQHITKKELDEIEIPVVDVEQQRNIVNCLLSVEKTLSLRRQEIGMLDELIKARFVEMFGKTDDKTYPSVRLGDYAKLQGGFAFKSKDFIDEGVPLVQIGNVNKDYLEWDVINAVPDEYLDRYREFALKKDDLVMAMTRPIIKSLDSVKIAKVAETDLPCLLNQRVGRFQIKDKLHPVFLEILCKTEDFKDYVERMSGNSLQPNISSKQVEDYTIILPPLKLQEHFADFVKQVDKSKVAVKRSLDGTMLLYNKLMQEYFG